MLTNNVDILNQTKQYVHLPTALLENIRSLLGPALSEAWEVLYTESLGGNGRLSKSYHYLARKMGCSRRTVIRYIHKLVDAGIIICQHRYFHGRSLQNIFTVLIPNSAIAHAKASRDRKVVDLEIDFSVNYHVDDLPVTIEPDQSAEIPINKDKPIPVDKRDFLAIHAGHNPVIGRPLLHLGVTSCHPSILITNQDNKKEGAKAPIAGLRQKTEEKKAVNSPADPKQVPEGAAEEIHKHVHAVDGVSSPSVLAKEAIYFVSTRKGGVSIMKAINAFKKLLRDGKWTTPYGMRGAK